MARSRDEAGERLWRRVVADVKPLAITGPRDAPAPPPPPAPPSPPPKRVRGRVPPPPLPPPARALPPTRGIDAAPDGHWERRFRGGRVEVERTLDLHGQTLAGAHAHLHRAIERAIGDGVRVLLVIAGKRRSPDEAPRGAIRRELEAWLAHGPFGDRVLSVRPAHPRHGGPGAVYVLLRGPSAKRSISRR